MCTHTLMHSCMHACMSAHEYANSHARKHACAHACTHAYMMRLTIVTAIYRTGNLADKTYTYTCMHARMLACMHCVLAHALLHACMRANKHTHTYTLW